MAKKQTKPNAFLMFSLDWKKNEEKKGHNFPGGIKEIMSNPNCNEEWRNLSDESKEYYKAMARNTKIVPTIGKRTGLGEKLSDIERAQLREQQFKDNMEEYISSWVKAAKDNNSVQKLKFYLIHINYFYYCTPDNGDPDYYPAEIAIAECSLLHGVQNIYTTTINEKVRTGYTCDAKQYSESTHQIPINWNFGKSNYKEIFNDICKFIEPGKENNRLPPLFTLFTREDVYCPTQSVLGRISMADEQGENFFLLYSFEDLFRHIHNASIEQSGLKEIDTIVASIEIKRDPFEFKSGLECEAHKILQGGVRCCSQSFVQRWFFVLCNFCCDALGIEMVPGVHMPKEKPLPNIGKLNSTLSSLNMNDSRRIHSSLDVTSASVEHRIRASERTYRDEVRRRTESKPLVFIQHGGPVKVPEPVERPLRRPHTKCLAPQIVDTTDTESIDFSESSFPSIGRGSALKKNSQDKKPGYASALKSK